MFTRGSRSVSCLCTALVRQFHRSQNSPTATHEESINELLDVYSYLADSEGNIHLSKFLNTVKRNGIWDTDMRLRSSLAKVNKLVGNGITKIDTKALVELTKDDYLHIQKTFRNEFIIPEFSRFCEKIDEMFWMAKSNNSGKVANYIPQLSRYSADYWAVSLCTVDGQRHSLGDTSVPFCLQGCARPLAYAMAVNDLGSQVIHQYVGLEPSGQASNSLLLNSERKPHNPMINSGAIVVTSLLKSTSTLPDRFDYFSLQTKKLAGREHVSYHNPTFLAERTSQDRNYAIAWFLKENKCFPEGTNLAETLDFYFQCCSVEVTCQSAAVIAASLASGGICPTTGEKVLSSESIRNMLSLMYSCGMYDYSGQFAFKVGLPAKAGVSGCVLLVVPNVMGLCLWSPPLDPLGNSSRAVQFSHQFIDTFNFHNYDSLRHTQMKSDPRKRVMETHVNKVSSILSAAFNNDTGFLQRQKLSGVDLGVADYDQRTALHVASSEGHLDSVKFLVEQGDVNPIPKDRWNRTPLDDAAFFGHADVVDYLRGLNVQHTVTTAA